MCSFVKSRMLLLVMRYNILLLRGARYKDVHIHQSPDREYGAVIALLAPWGG